VKLPVLSGPPALQINTKAPEGDCLAVKLRPGNVHSAQGRDEVLPIIDRYRRRRQTVVVRADAAFALPALYEALER
jgi:DDE family transposase